MKSIVRFFLKNTKNMGRFQFFTLVILLLIDLLYVTVYFCLSTKSEIVSFAVSFAKLFILENKFNRRKKTPALPTFNSIFFNSSILQLLFQRI